METKNSKPVPLSEQWPEVNKIAETIAHEACMKINRTTVKTNPKIKEEIKGCEYWRRGLLELVIAELEKRV